MRRFLPTRVVKGRLAVAAPIVVSCLVAILLSDAFWEASFDTPFRFQSEIQPQEAIVVTMDESLYQDRDLNPGYEEPFFNRATHARLLDKLTADGAPLVVFDIYFQRETDEDSIFAAAITNHGNVIIAAPLEEVTGPEFSGSRTNDPAQAFRDLPGCTIAFPDLHVGVVRTFPPEWNYRASIPVAAARAFGRPVEENPPFLRWVRYYGDRMTLPTISYQGAISQAPGFFKDKAVFIGGGPRVKNHGEDSDEFETPFTRFSSHKMRGVEVHATMFLNLVRNEFLTEARAETQFLLLLATALLFGTLVTFFRPLQGLIVVLVGGAVVSIAAILIFVVYRTWFNWILAGWVEIPVAWITSSLVYSRRLFYEKESLRHELESVKSASNRPAPAPERLVSASVVLAGLEPVPAKDAPVSIRDFELLAEIGTGAYGQVWLARNLVGAYRAIKILFRKNFPDQRPFEREFEGVRNFEAISRAHPGWVSILHVGKDEDGGFFYYVMDPADDLQRGPNIDPAQYAPKTLGKLLVENEYLPVLQCVDLGIHLSDALAALHERNLVHRDVKPSNIIFANNKPRLADIGLVAHLDGAKTIVGTPGFMPKEGLGSPLADIFGLGRVLYQAATGCPPDRHPELPTTLANRLDARDLMRLMEIINKACAHVEWDRYQSARELHNDLVKLRMKLVDARP